MARYWGLVATVEVVTEAIQAADKVGMVAEVGSVQLRFTEEQISLGRIIRIKQPLTGHRRIGEAQRQRQLAADRRADLFPAQQRRIACVGLAKVVVNAVEYRPADQAGRYQCQQAGQHQGQQ